MFNGKIIGYQEARNKIYLPTYKYVLDNKLETMVGWLMNRIKNGENFVFLDYNTNTDYHNLASPLSHAGLVRDYVEGRYPTDDESPLWDDRLFPC